MKHLGDITKINGAEIPIVDCITGGSPCQDLSVAGKRAGLSGERSGLFMEQLRIVKEMRKRDQEENGRTNQFIRPRFMVWENVPGAFSSNNGKDFQAVLTEIVRIVEPDAPDVPMPDKGKWTKSGCIYDEMGRWSVAWRVHDAQFWGVPQRRKRIALVADFGGLAAPEVQFERKSVSGYSEPSRETRKGSSGDSKECADRTEQAGNNDMRCFNQLSQSAVYKEDEISVSVTVCGGSYGGGSEVLVCGDVLTEKQRGRLMDTITLAVETGGGRERKIVYREPIMMSDRKGHNGISDNGIGTTLTSQEKERPLIMANVVRRLTPVECERLQGFPDGWTDIGEWVDSKGKKHQTADSARYKALGNSIALPFWFYLLRRISALYERPATLGSLFDGIGGFPLCWERCNGHGTAIWASEIEEFPIAVTKRHFPERGDAE